MGEYDLGSRTLTQRMTIKRKTRSILAMSLVLALLTGLWGFPAAALACAPAPVAPAAETAKPVACGMESQCCCAPTETSASSHLVEPVSACDCSVRAPVNAPSSDAAYNNVVVRVPLAPPAPAHPILSAPDHSRIAPAVEETTPVRVGHRRDGPSRAPPAC
jgi:hypothetical protein